MKMENEVYKKRVMRWENEVFLLVFFRLEDGRDIRD